MAHNGPEFLYKNEGHVFYDEPVPSTCRTEEQMFMEGWRRLKALRKVMHKGLVAVEVSWERRAPGGVEYRIVDIESSKETVEVV